MSLKAFHLFFVIVAMVCTSAYAMWCALSFLHEGGADWLAAALVAFFAGAALLVHGVIFYKQTESEPWL